MGVTAPRRGRCGMGRILVRGGDLPGNLARAREMVRQAAAAGCALVVRPECLDVGRSDPLARQLAAPIPGPTTDALAELARGNGVFVVAGVVGRAADRLYNAAVPISPASEIRLHHRKTNVLGMAQDPYAIGDRPGVAETALDTFGRDICADNFADALALGHALARQGVRRILSPRVWAVPPEYDEARRPYGAEWVQASRTLAALCDLAVLGVRSVAMLEAGPWAGRRRVGCALAVGPGGAVLARGSCGRPALPAVAPDLPTAPARGGAMTAHLSSRGYQGP